jgi:autotransporter-associated beta strand protein
VGTVDGLWDNTTANWKDGAPPNATGPDTTYTVGDNVFFTDNFAGSNTTISPQGSSTNATNITFVHVPGTVATNYTFNRSGDLPASGVTPFGANSGTGTAQVLTLDTGFLGKVSLRARANSTSFGSVIIRSGTLELNDGGALPGNAGNSANNPGPVTLAGGTLAINVNTAGNVQPASSQLAGTLTVTADSTLANTSADTSGGPYRIWGSATAAAVNVQSGVTLTIAPGAVGSRLDSNLSGSVGTFSLGANSGVLRLGSPGSGGVNATFDAGTNGGIIRAGNTTVNLGALTGAAGTRVEAQDSAGPGTDTISVGGKNVDATFNGVIADGVNTTAARTAAVTKVGTGVQTLAGVNTYTGETTVNAGTLRVTGSIASSSGVTVNDGVYDAATTQTLKSLTVTGTGLAQVSSTGAATTVLKTANLVVDTNSSATNTAAVDLGTHAMVVDYAAGNSPLASIKAAVKSGYASGAWTGPGIRSVAAAASASAGSRNRAVGYGEASALYGAAGGNFLGQSVDGDAIVLRYTVAGDATLDGTVNFDDLLSLAKNYNSSGAAVTYAQGDFDYNDTVNFDDLLVLAKNYNQALPAASLAQFSPAFQADVAAAFAQVPEPATAGVLAAGCIGLMVRRRRR